MDISLLMVHRHLLEGCVLTIKIVGNLHVEPLFCKNGIWQSDYVSFVLQSGTSFYVQHICVIGNYTKKKN